MTGQLGAAELAYLGLALAPQLPLLLLGMGFVMGGVVLIAQPWVLANSESGHIMRVAVRHAWIAGR